MKKKKSGCLIFFIVIIVSFFLAVGFGIFTSKKDMQEHPEKYDESIAAKYIDISSEESKLIDDILIQCGISEVSEFKHDELLDNAHVEGETGYRLTSGDIDNIILYLNENMKVHSLIYADHKLYAKGKVKSTIQDFTFSTKEATEYQLLCEEKVKSILKSPSTAKFPNILEWGFGKTKKKITIQGYVDAQNSFGAETRSDFQFIFDRETDTIKSFIFDGEEQITQ